MKKILKKHKKLLLEKFIKSKEKSVITFLKKYYWLFICE